MRGLLASVLLAIASAGQAAVPTPEDRRATLAIGDAAELETALSKGDARRARALEKRIRERAGGTFAALDKQAQKGVPEARFALALLLSRGLRAAPDAQLACKYFGQAADAGHAAASYHAALCTLDTDPARAARLMQAAAARQHPAAQEAIGRACLEDKRERNLDCAVRNVAAAARAGRPSAQSLFAWMHAMGIGVDREPITALALYLTAAGKGELAAQNNLGELYESGVEPGLATDPRRAALWYESAARGGFGIAQYNLGRMYASGVGVEYDATAARYWLGKAEQGGIASAAALLRRLDADTSARPR